MAKFPRTVSPQFIEELIRQRENELLQMHDHYHTNPMLHWAVNLAIETDSSFKKQWAKSIQLTNEIRFKRSQ